MSTLEVIAMRIWTLEVVHASGGAKNKAYVIVDIGGLGSGSNMTIIAFVHAVHGIGLRMRGQNNNWGKTNIRLQSKRGGKKLTSSMSAQNPHL